MADTAGPITDPRRLAAVAATRLLDTPAEPAFDRLARLAATVLGTPYAFVTVVDDARSYWKSCIGVTTADRQNTVAESFCQYVVGTGEPLLVGDTVADPRTRDNPSNASMGVRAWAGYPVRAPGGEVLGTFCVVDTTTRSWTDHDAQVLETLAEAAGGEIALRAAVRDAAAFAGTLQASLLPPALPEVDGLAVAATYRAAADGGGVVGDFFDVFQAGGRWLVLIGDVSGHGVEAAKLAALARWTVRATSAGDSPAAILANLHTLLLDHVGSDETYLTAQLATLSIGEGGAVEVVLAGAGHPAALVRRSDGTVETRGIGGRPLGLLPDPHVAEERFGLGGDDLLVLHTDGLTESRTGTDLLGDDAVAAVLADAGREPADVAAALEAAALAASGGTLADDVAIVAVRPVG